MSVWAECYNYVVAGTIMVRRCSTIIGWPLFTDFLITSSPCWRGGTANAVTPAKDLARTNTAKALVHRREIASAMDKIK
jgi:hypothetical protein